MFFLACGHSRIKTCALVGNLNVQRSINLFERNGRLMRVGMFDAIDKQLTDRLKQQQRLILGYRRNLSS